MHENQQLIEGQAQVSIHSPSFPQPPQPMFSEPIKQDYHSDQHVAYQPAYQDPYSVQQLYVNQPSSQQPFMIMESNVVVHQPPKQFPGFTTTQIPTSSGLFEGMVKDQQGRWVMGSAFNWNAWIFGITGILMIPLIIGIPFLILAILSRNIDFIFDEEKRELIVRRYGAFIEFSCLDAELSISYSDIKDAEVQSDYTIKVNGVPNGIMYLITRDGQRVQLTKGYNGYNSTVWKKNKILSIIRSH